MEKRIIGILLTLLGVAGLIAAAWNFMNAGNGNYNTKQIAIYSILGFTFFIAGIGIVRNTNDKPT